MLNTESAVYDTIYTRPQTWSPVPLVIPDRDKHTANGRPPRSRDAEFLRKVAWDIGEQKPVEAFTPTANHVGLAMVSPYQGFAHWRILPSWIEQTAWARGDGWHDCRMVLRLYDVSCINFTGLNANRIQDETLPCICGQRFFTLPRPGTWQLAEVGFVLRNGEFVPAARSQAVAFAPDAVSSRGEQNALLVNHGRVEEVSNVWEQEKILQERRQPRLRKSLRIATFAFASSASGQDGPLAKFVSELATGQTSQGHEVHVLVPASDQLRSYRQLGGVHYHPLEIAALESPLLTAQAFARAAEQRMEELPPIDLLNLHEWMTGLVPLVGIRPTVLSLTSLEVTRRNGAPPTTLSQSIQQMERELARDVDCILTPDWLRERALTEFGIDGGRIHAFPMEGRLPNEWEAPLDFGQVKKEIGVGPLDRLLLFIGPLEHGAGVDLLLEALPVLLQRAPNLRLAYVGAGNLFGHLERRMHELRVAHAVRLLGHVEGPLVTRLLRAAEALVLPSRYRLAFDDAVVDLARRAGRAVVTTHGGPAHLIRHEETGIITYDNPGSMVWAVDRILGDPANTERMGRRGRRSDGGSLNWGDVARRYMELCAACFSELSETRL